MRPIETLEARCLMSAAVVDGVLTITGDEADNLVQVRFNQGTTDSPDDDMIVVLERTRGTATSGSADSGDQATLQLTRRQRRRLARQARRAARLAASDSVAANPAEPTRTEFNIAQHGITSMFIDVGGGKDFVVIGNAVKLPVTINAGAGDDRIRAGGGDATINGGDGDDHIRGGGGVDILNGDAGDDDISALHWDVVDTINGGPGNDFAYFDQAGSFQNGLTLGDRKPLPPGVFGSRLEPELTPIPPDVVTDVETSNPFPYPEHSFHWEEDPKEPLTRSIILLTFTDEQRAALNSGHSMKTARHLFTEVGDMYRWGP